MTVVGRCYIERGEPVLVLCQWRTKNPREVREDSRPSIPITGGDGGEGPRNVTIRRASGELVVRPFRGLRKPKDGDHRLGGIETDPPDEAWRRETFAAVCACGWRSRWSDSTQGAANAHAYHVDDVRRRDAIAHITPGNACRYCFAPLPGVKAPPWHCEGGSCAAADRARVAAEVRAAALDEHRVDGPPVPSEDQGALW